MEELDNRFFNHGKMREVNISSEMRDNFLSYSMSVIIDRALPDIRDGMKPVHRRVMWAMFNGGYTPDKPHVKSANIVGDVLGKYHPHGDSAAYETMVRMAQPFSYRYPLVDGHGNFGSIDGDEAAAMRYTEARMSKISLELLQDIKKDTIDWKDNYDARLKEPVVLPSRFPNLLVNGSMGIAVGMATNMPPHNLGESIDSVIAVLENPDITIQELMDNYLHGPDFPTGGYIVGRTGIRQAYETGRGSITVRSKVDIEEMPGGKHKIIVREIPYLVNKTVLVQKIADLHKDKIIDGLADMRDLSNDRNGIRVEIELKKDIQPDVILNQLYRLTPLQASFGVNNNVLVDNKPMLLSVKKIIEYYIEHQIDVIRRRTKYDLEKSEERAHILEGLKIALDNIDEIIAIIKSSSDDPEALKRMNEKFGLDEIQGKAILDMQLRRLTGLQREKVEEELKELYVLIADLKDILANHYRVVEIIKNELLAIKEKFNDERRTEIIEGDIDVEDEDLIPMEDIVISLSMKDYIKRLPINTYKTQNRGGVGIKGMGLNEDDVVFENVTMSTHDYLLIFTDKGKVYRIKGYKVPEASRNAKGTPIINIINIEKGEKVRSLVPVSRDHENDGYLFFVTKRGICKRVPAAEFESIRQNGKIAITMKEDDELINVLLTTGEDEIIIGAANGKAVRFDERGVREMGRNASGVKGMSVETTEVIGALSDKNGRKVLVVTKNGYGKMSEMDDYRLVARGGKGVKSININEKNGDLVALKAVNGDEDVMIMSNNGIVIRTHLENVSTMGRDTQGVRLMKLADGAFVSSVTVLDHQEEEPVTEEAEANE